MSALVIVRDANAIRPPVWVLDDDPTTFGFATSANADLWQILFRTDVPSIYFKSGPLVNNWTLAGSASSGAFPDIADIPGVLVQVGVALEVAGDIAADQDVAVDPAHKLVTSRIRGWAGANLLIDFVGAPAVLEVAGSCQLNDTLSVAGRVKSSASEVAQGIATPAVLPVGTTDDYSFVGMDVRTIRQATDAGNSALSGLDAGLLLDSGLLYTFINLGPGILSFLNEDAGSAPGHRFKLPGGASITLTVDSAVTIWYDVTNLRWRRYA